MLIKCPDCSYSREMDARYVPVGDSQVTCPKCGRQFELHNPGQEEATLQQPPGQPESAAPDTPAPTQPEPALAQAQAGPGQTGPDAPALTIPWEDPSRGLVSGYLATLKLVMFAPQRFFTLMPRNNHYGRPIAFALISLALGLLVYLLLMSLFTLGIGLVYVPLVLGLVVVVMVPYLFISAAIWHLFLKIFDAGDNGYKTTLRVSCYSCGPYIWYIVPVVGSLITSIWCLICMIVGIKYAQQTTYKRVIASIALYVVFCLVCLVGITYLLVTFGDLANQMPIYDGF